MDVLLTTFLAAALAEWGDRTQLLAVALALRYGRPGPVLAGIAVGAFANALIASAGGAYVHSSITLRAVSLLVALALIFAGVAGLISKRTPNMGEGWKTGAFVSTAAAFFLVEFADKTQFLTFGLAAQFNSLFLAALGATAGVVAANTPAVLLRERFVTVLPLETIRIGISILFLVAGFIVAVNALRLV